MACGARGGKSSDETEAETTRSVLINPLQEQELPSVRDTLKILRRQGLRGVFVMQMIDSPQLYLNLRHIRKLRKRGVEKHKKVRTGARGRDPGRQ